jgi:uncharacterized membrane protein YjgN (DUF898 family)
MQRSFGFALEGRQLFPLFIAFYVPFVILEVLVTRQSTAGTAAGSPDLSQSLRSLAGSLGIFLLTVLFYVPFLRRIVPAATFDGLPFAFRGAVGRYLGLNLMGLLLSLVTLGIYYPWYVTRVTRYLVAEASYKGQPLEFTGRGGRLLLVFLASLVAPGVIIGVLVAPSLRGSGAGLFFGSLPGVLLAVLLALVALAFFSGYVYGFYRWLFTNLRCGEHAVHWNAELGPSVAFVWLQLLLSLVTAGIYGPAAAIRLYRYFAERSALAARDGPPWGRLSFVGSTRRGFGLLWGQALLTLVTAGIYAPWALARIGAWYLSSTRLEGASA